MGRYVGPTTREPPTQVGRPVSLFRTTTHEKALTFVILVKFLVTELLQLQFKFWFISDCLHRFDHLIKTSFSIYASLFGF